MLLFSLDIIEFGDTMIIEGTLQHKKTGWQIQSKTGIMQLEMILKKYKDKKVIVTIEERPSDIEIVLSKLCRDEMSIDEAIKELDMPKDEIWKLLDNFEYIGW